MSSSARDLAAATLLVVAGALATACQSPATAALIQVESELGSEPTRVTVEVRDARDELVSDQFAFDVTDPKNHLPLSFRVVRGREPTHEFVVRATAYAADEVLAEAKLRVVLIEGETVHRTLRLTAVCRGVQCDDGWSCDASSGKCAAVFGSGTDAGSGGAGGAGTGARRDSEAGRGDAAADSGEASAADRDGGASGAAAVDGGAALGAAAAGGRGTDTADAGSGGAAGEALAGKGMASAGSGGTGTVAQLPNSGASAAADGGNGGAGGAGRAGSGGVAGAGRGGGTAGRATGLDTGSGELSEPGALARVTHNGLDYCIQNDVFDPDASQTVSYQSTSFTVTRTSGANTNGISLPSVYIGSLWGYPSREANLPLVVDDLKGLPVVFSHNAGSVAGTYNALHALWFSKSPDGGPEQPSGGYLEVWYYTHPDQQPQGERVEKGMTIAGVTGSWDLFIGMFNGKPILVYLRTEPLSDVQGDLYLFLADALRRGELSPTWFLVAVIAGFEIRTGGAGLTANEIVSEVR